MLRVTYVERGSLEVIATDSKYARAAIVYRSAQGGKWHGVLYVEGVAQPSVQNRLSDVLEALRLEAIARTGEALEIVYAKEADRRWVGRQLGVVFGYENVGEDPHQGAQSKLFDA